MSCHIRINKTSWTPIKQLRICNNVYKNIYKINLLLPFHTNEKIKSAEGNISQLNVKRNLFKFMLYYDTIIKLDTNVKKL